jgi:methionyl-tRNA formyltransferase
MRVAICSGNDLASTFALNALRPVFEQHESMLLQCDDAHPHGTAAPELEEFLYFMQELPLRHLFPLIERDAPTGDDVLLTPNEIVARYRMPIEIVEPRISGEVVEKLGAFAPEIMLSVRFLPIFREPLLSLPRHGIYNIHSGALPAYAGVLTPLRALLNGESSIGCTLHRIDAGIDTGPIVGIRHVEVQRGKSVVWYYCHLYPLCVPLFCDIIARLERGESVRPTPQNAAQRRYYRSPDKAEIATFVAQGHRLVRFDDYLELTGRFHRQNGTLTSQPPWPLAARTDPACKAAAPSPIINS